LIRQKTVGPFCQLQKDKQKLLKTTLSHGIEKSALADPTRRADVLSCKVILLKGLDEVEA